MTKRSPVPSPLRPGTRHDGPARDSAGWETLPPHFMAAVEEQGDRDGQWHEGRPVGTHHCAW
ncbi:MAG: hypothetical protein M3Q84_05040, partial [Actinomycetota bacterium]|nr:hypothetical protein [Actinomycetota bacterium]